MTSTETGYLDNAYLTEDYGAGQIIDHYGMQVNQIINKQTSVGQQATQVINAQKSIGMQAAMIVNTQTNVGMQAAQTIVDSLRLVGMQAQQVVSTQLASGMQALMTVAAEKIIGMQALMTAAGEANIGMMASQILGNNNIVRMSALHDTLKHHLVGVYLEGGYLEDAYLADGMNAFLYMQAQMINKVTVATGMQATQVINSELSTRMQALMRIDTQKNIGMQTTMLTKTQIAMQATMVIYNVTQLRIMTTFPSRGTAALAGLNWTSTSTAAGDFSPNNLNTDVVEEVFRSAAGSAALVTLTSDTGLSQGVPLDTIAILGHNLTRSATVQVQGSNDPLFGTINTSFNMTVETDDMFYIAPTFPTLTGQNRYWRFVIQDPTNSDGYIEIGTILYGVSDIFSVLESFSNPIERGFRHFKDALNTEGFTNVTNDRALKKFLKLRFEKLNFFNRNYTILEDMMKYARTSLKVLVIPTPEYPSRFAIYAKLTTLPEISHTSIGEREEYIDLNLEWDESL